MSESYLRGDDNRPQAIRPAEELFTVVLWFKGQGWTTVAWTMDRGTADDVAAMHLRRSWYTRSEVWYQGRMVAEQGRPADRPEPRQRKNPKGSNGTDVR